MELTNVIKSPILTEKSNILKEQNQVFVFKVHYHANKFQIKEAVETIFQVKVAKVNVIKVDKKPKNVGRFHGFTNRYKKAMVWLKEGQNLNYLPEDEETTTNELKAQEIKVEKEAKAAKAAEVEKRVAQKLAAKKQTATKVAKTTKAQTAPKRKVGGE